MPSPRGIPSTNTTYESPGTFSIIIQERSFKFKTTTQKMSVEAITLVQALRSTCAGRTPNLRTARMSITSS